jgi:hypothetical protein
VEYLLRKPINTKEDLVTIGADAAKGEKYLTAVKAMASRLGMRRGALSRAALPFDDHTSLADQSNLNNRRGVYSIEVGAHTRDARLRGPLRSNMRATQAKQLLSKGLVTESELAVLTEDATTLRALLRVKIADDADLDQAEAAVAELRRFLDTLGQESARVNKTAFELYKSISG